MKLSERYKQKKAAKAVSLSVFFFMSFVSVVILFTEEELVLIDFLLMIGSPIVLGVFSYFVILNHDPNISD